MDFSKSIVESEIIEVEEFDVKIFQNLFNLGILGNCWKLANSDFQPVFGIPGFLFQVRYKASRSPQIATEQFYNCLFFDSFAILPG